MHVVLYTRHGCHLCADAWRVLEAERAAFPLSLQAVDIDADPHLVALYGESVPVVTVNGQVRFRGQVNPVLLRRLLQALERSEE